MIVPTCIIDLLVAKAFELKMPRIAEGLIYWFKGTHRQNLVRYTTSAGVHLWLNPHKGGLINYNTFSINVFGMLLAM